MSGARGHCLGLGLGLAIALALAGCGRESVTTATPPPANEQNLVGTPKARLLACAGSPAIAYQQAGLEYLGFRAKTTIGGGYLQDAPDLPLVGSPAIGSKGTEVLCQASVVLKGGVVDAVTLRSDPPQDRKTTETLCLPMLARCLSP